MQRMLMSVIIAYYQKNCNGRGVPSNGMMNNYYTKDNSRTVNQTNNNPKTLS